MKKFLFGFLTLVLSGNAFALTHVKVRVNLRGNEEMPYSMYIHNTELSADQFDCYSKNGNFDCNSIVDVGHFLPKWYMEFEGKFKTFEMQIQLFLICSDGSEVAINNIPFFSRKKFEKPFHYFGKNIDITDSYLQCKSRTGVSPTSQ